MTPYQRGNRDGLRWLAAVARQRAEAHAAEAARCDTVLDAPVEDLAESIGWTPAALRIVKDEDGG